MLLFEEMFKDLYNPLELTADLGDVGLQYLRNVEQSS